MTKPVSRVTPTTVTQSPEINPENVAQLVARLNVEIDERYPAFSYGGVGKVGLSLPSADWRIILEALRDTGRLDWLQSRAFTAYRSRDPETHELYDHAVVVNEDLYERFDQRRGVVKPTLREAIDTASGGA